MPPDSFDGVRFGRLLRKEVDFESVKPLRETALDHATAMEGRVIEDEVNPAEAAQLRAKIVEMGEEQVAVATL